MYEGKKFDVDAAREAIKQGQSGLLFPDEAVASERWNIAGLIIAPEEGNPETLNIFRLFLSGASKASVEGYLDYLAEQGQKGIQVCVKPLEETYQPEQPPAKQPSLEELLAMFKENNSNPDFLFMDRGQTFGIERLYIGTRPPYRVLYSIDPPNARSVGLNQTTDAVNFSGDIVSVYCTAPTGHVDMALYEYNNSNTPVQRGGRSLIDINQQSIPGVTRAFTGYWEVRVTGKDAINNYRVDYEADYAS